MSMRQVPFVDAHIHLWDLNRLRYPWLSPPFNDDSVNGSVEAIAKTYLPADYRADSRGWNVVGVVHVDAGAHPDDAEAETTWLQGLADEGGLPQAIVAFAALNDTDVEARLARHAAFTNVRGIRHIINWHPDPRKSYSDADALQDPAWARGYGLLAKYGLSFDLQCYPGQLESAAAIASRHPDTPVILNHAGMPIDRDEAGLAQWRRGLRRLAELPQAAVKLSGFGLVDHHWTVESIRPLVLETIEVFGIDRCMFASDVPTDKLFGTFDGVMDAYDTIVSGFSDDERRDLFGRNAARVYRIDVPV